MDALDCELNRWMAVPFSWAETNCAFVVGRWIAQVKGIDPARQDHFTFDDMGSCHKATGWFTDPVGVFNDRMQRVGIKRTETPTRGDVGVLRVPGQKHPVCGVFTGHSWALKSQEGCTSFAPTHVQVLAAWGVGFA